MNWEGYRNLKDYVEKRISEFGLISEDRKESLTNLAKVLTGRRAGAINVIFICTHNSRRSHMAHLWASVAAFRYGVEGVNCFSGGTEATAFFPLAVKAIKEAGFIVTTRIPGANPVFLVSYPGASEGVRVFSKKYTDPPNPTREFHAVMTCSDADEACPVVTGAATRHAITYEDPKSFDGSPHTKEGYAERCRQIAREMLFIFSHTS
ncbi:MAG: protein-tyrosine-phosphatase [Bacteroidetes bacterium]|nr:protein-tyrosine-phosphatase [Bacteroidota bacterium]